MNHLIQLYAQEIVTALTAIAVILMGANIGQAITAIVRKHDIADLDEANRSIVAELTEERVKREHADVLNERMGDEQIEYLLNMKKLRQQLYDAEAERDHAISMYGKCLEDVNAWKSDYVRAANEALRWQKVAKGVEVDRDWWKKYAEAVANENERLESERATLYFRNAKGQIEPITPKPRKPHTLKHGMRVKDPSAYQAKRIFADAKRAGMEVFKPEMIGDEFPSVFFGNDVTGIGVVMPCKHAEDNIYISATEFRRRIKGEVK
jgi:hypothetical protein